MNKLPIAIPGNCFNQKSYIKSDPNSGLLATRHGDRLIAIPEILLRSIPKTLREEAGEASYLALHTFGESWGQSFCDRVLQDIYQYYRQPVLDTIASEFFVSIESAWAVHGLGKPSIDFSLSSRGLLIVSIANSGISEGQIVEENATARSFSLESGFLSGWFSVLTNQKLRACASNWQSAPESLQFLVGTVSRIEKIESTFLKRGQIDPSMLASI